MVDLSNPFPDNYMHDVFISYPHDEMAQNWVCTHFAPRLKKWLNASLPVRGLINRDNRVWFDKAIETGFQWDPEIKERLRRSKCLIAILLPCYFESCWCLSECKSMMKRQTDLRMGQGEKPALYFPIVYAGRNFFPKEFLSNQHWDLSDYASDLAQWITGDEGTEFDRKVREISKKLVGSIRQAPKYEPWEIVTEDKGMDLEDLSSWS